LADSVGWRVRRGSAIRSFSDRLVVQGRRTGMLDLSVGLLASGEADRRRLGLLGPLAAACTSEGIRRDTGIVSWLHWPNLVTIGGRVVATTSISLAEPPRSGEKTQVTLRICVNCFGRSQAEFPSALPSSSILDVLGVEIDLDLLRDKVLHALDWYHAEWERGMDRKLVDRVKPTVAWMGHDVEVRMADGKVLRGRATSLDDLGSLLLEERNGRGRAKTRAIPAESVELVQPVN
jgi:biotin-(acetyl-CoA carboxylase) ligase